MISNDALGRYLHLLIWEEKPMPRRRQSRKSLFRTTPPRSWKYKAWIRTLPSAVSGLYGCEACHTGGHGLSEKSSDFQCVPLLPAEHRELGAGVQAFQARYGVDLQALVRRLNSIWFQSWKIEGGQFL
jgi:hypothetical protein